MSLQVQVEQLLSRWKELRDAGQVVSAEELCAEQLHDADPQLVAALERQILTLELTSQFSAGSAPTFCAEIPKSGAERWSDRDEVVFSVSAFESFRFHARGGLGEVFVANDKDLRRDVALKFIQRPHEQDPERKALFVIEGEITAQLEHPGVVPVYGMGHTSDGRPFHVMRFIRGNTLAEQINRFHLASHDDSQQTLHFHQLLSRFVSVCHTVAYAHNRGIVHRDIKPENIMLGKYGETLVVDWGLAHLVDRDERARASGEETLVPGSGDTPNSLPRGVVGTPRFMSPEQAAGEGGINTATDVYSLGATLYKLLTNAAPIPGTSLADILERTIHGQFRAPRQINPRIAPALEAICLKAMSVQPQDRYATPMDLAAEIERWLADEPVAAYREPVRHKLFRWSRRNRSLSIAVLGALVVCLGVSAIAAALLGWKAQKEHEAVVLARQARENGVRVSTRFAAKTVATAIDLRWRILEAEAKDPELRELLIQVGEAPQAVGETWDKLQLWLSNRFDEHSETTKAASWFITDARGKQLARRPVSETIGRTFAYRDYFHGQGPDFPPSDERLHPPIQQPHRSNAFRSKATGNQMVAFSVPVWNAKLGSPNREVVGVLAMTVELGQFQILSLGSNSGQIAVLVDTREDGPGSRGLILQHPSLRAAGAVDLAGVEDQAFRLDAARVEKLIELRRRYLTQNLTGLADLDGDYRDPLGDSGQRWLAAFEPVMVQGRPVELRDTGWVVIVQEPY